MGVIEQVYFHLEYSITKSNTNLVSQISMVVHQKPSSHSKEHYIKHPRLKMGYSEPIISRNSQLLINAILRSCLEGLLGNQIYSELFLC